MNAPFRGRRAAVLGAGVMGAQIAAHLANCDVDTVLLELPSEGPDERATVKSAVASLRKLKPPPLASASRASLITTGTYATGLEQLRDCDLVIEAIAERPEWKHDLYRKVAPYLAPHAVLTTNTSGISLSVLQEALPESLRKRFCGTHFFNPPRYMHLVELIPGPEMDPDLLDDIETFLTSTLGKGVIRAKDTPNFISNRVGVFAMLATFHHAGRLGLPFDVVDALTGVRIGRPKSATFRTADVVGLDTLGHVIEGSARMLPEDPWHPHFVVPTWLGELISAGTLGQKTRKGVYEKTSSGITVLDPATGKYGAANPVVDPEVEEILAEKDAGLRFERLRASSHPQAQLLWCLHRDVWHYAAVHLAEIAHCARDVDLALRWGFGWTHGPFELWQQVGWGRVSSWLSAEIADQRTMADRPLPPWVMEREAAHEPIGSWDAAGGALVPRSRLPVYTKQAAPPRVLGEAPDELGETVFETDSVRLVEGEDGVGVLSFKSRMNVIGSDVLDGVSESIDMAEARLRAVVIWQPEPPFSAGANLKQVSGVLDRGDLDAVDKIVRRFQGMTTRFRTADIPVVTAVSGMALGGGCEFAMHAARTVCALESYVGLVEIGVGLLPAGGGLRELARRASRDAIDGDPFPIIQRAFETVCKAAVSGSGAEAIELGLFEKDTRVVIHADELLHVARKNALAVAASWQPPLPRPIRVAGRTGAATLRGLVVNMLEGGFVSEHDAKIAGMIADVLCGGDVDAGSEVSEQWLLDLERHAFVALCGEDKTRARIAHMLEKGKPLRN